MPLARTRLRLDINLSLGLILATALAAACGGGSNEGNSGGAVSDGADAGGGQTATLEIDGGGGASGNFVNDGGVNFNTSVKSIEVSPATATLVSTNGAKASQTFGVIAHYSDGSTAPVTSGVSWTASSSGVGTLGTTGTFTASGTTGGLVPISATYSGLSASASASVKLLLQTNAGSVSAAAQAGLAGATATDPKVVWAYPYDGTVWARGLLAPKLQWNGGTATDAYYVHITSPYFELQAYATATGAPSSQLLIDASSWTAFTESTAGAASVEVARWNGTAATVIASQNWTVAPASIRSTIYYWSNNLGRILRIKPGASQPDDFANQPPLNDPKQYQQAGCLMTCHTVSADGSTLVSGGGTYGGSYNLLTSSPMHSLGGTWELTPNAAGQPAWMNIQWYTPAVSPDGKYVLTNSMGEALALTTGATSPNAGLYTSADGVQVTGSGVEGIPMAQPTWSPDGSKVAFVDAANPAAWEASWNAPPKGDLKVMDFNATASPMFSNEQTMVTVGALPRMTWPTITPDGQWVAYARAATADTRDGHGDLYFASAITPNEEVRLANANGDGYAFAAGARDVSWNFEPSFAPVAAGGYYWLVFTSRRTYGNTLTGQAEPCANVSSTCAADANCATDSCASICACTVATEVKQLWVVAIDQNPTSGKDPSHAAFHLEGQDETNLAMRGFMALPPCGQAGASCSAGTDCCGGFCGAGEDGGAGQCTTTPPACSQDSDKCTTTSDCCNASAGTTCINKVCSEPTPK
jgi:hypothetical protein